jgi:hypothetical protein
MAVATEQDARYWTGRGSRAQMQWCVVVERSDEAEVKKRRCDAGLAPRIAEERLELRGVGFCFWCKAWSR